MTGELPLDGLQGHAKGMLSGQHNVIDPMPEAIVGNVTVFHPQLRDLLQPAAEKGKVLYIDSFNVSCADFNTMKPPSTCYTLDFAAVCLTTGCGFVAAGGEMSELDIRPLPSVKERASLSEVAAATESHLAGSSRQASRSTSNHASAFDAVVIDDGEAQMEASGITYSAPGPSTQHRSPPVWHLRTPTGGSINNSIFIRPDISINASSQNATTSRGDTRPHPASSDESDENRHRGKRRKEQNCSKTTMASRSNDEAGLVAADDSATEEERARKVRQPYLATDFQGRLGWRLDRDGAVTYRQQATDSRGKGKPKSLRLLVSNNDQTVRMLRLRPPSRIGRRSAAPGEAEEGLDAGMPGLSRTQTLKLPTSINHTSFSPDGRHMVSVGDTSDVFLFQVDTSSGAFIKIATYTASSDASFSTAWSPDSLQFAVASQDGVISIWDVRSAHKIADLRTTTRALHYRSEAARVIKWSPRGDLLAFSEDSCVVHVVETTSFTVVQHIRVPSSSEFRRDALGNSLSTQCTPEQGRRTETSAELDDIAMTLWGPNASVSESSSANTGPFARDGGSDAGNGAQSRPEEYDWWLGSTSPARFASGSRSAAAAASTNSLRPWPNGRRYRELGNTLGRASAMDRALLGDWSSTRHSLREIALGDRRASSLRAAADQHQDSPSLTSAGNRADSTNAAATGNASAARGSSALGPSRSTSRLMSGSTASIEALLADLTDATERSASWGTMTVHGPRFGYHRTDVDISGLTWDPDGDFLYISTDKLILRYRVRDLSYCSGSAALR